MAMQLNAGDTDRLDEFAIDPKEIVVENSNGRWQPHGPEDIERMVASYEHPGQDGKPQGQIQAVQVRRIHDKKVQLVLGWRRYLGAMAYNERHPDKPMKLRCKVVLINEEEAFCRNITENLERTGTTAVDDAYNQNRLREGYGWNDTRIAKFYNVTPPVVGKLKKLLSLPKETLLLVHGKSLSVDAAVVLADLPPNEQQEVLAAEPVVTSQAVVNGVRDRKIDKGGKGPGRTLKDVRAVLEGMTGPAEPVGLKTMADEFLKFIQGKIKGETLEKRVRGLFGSTAPVSAESVPVADTATDSTVQPVMDVCLDAVTPEVPPVSEPPVVTEPEVVPVAA